MVILESKPILLNANFDADSESAVILIGALKSEDNLPCFSGRELLTESYFCGGSPVGRVSWELQPFP